MPNMMQLKPFEPAHDGPARLNNAGNKAGVAIRLALRPCGVTAYGAADAINAIGGSAYSPSYTKSAQFAKSYYGAMAFGAYGSVETVGEHIACVRAHDGDDAADGAWAALPEQLRDTSTQVLVIYAYAAGGRAVGRYGVTTLPDLPDSADAAAAARAKLGRKAKRQRSGSGQSSKRGQSGSRQRGQRSQRKGGSQGRGQSGNGSQGQRDADSVAQQLTGQTEGQTGDSQPQGGEGQGEQGEAQTGE
jgi:hypothetical protein